MNDLVCATFDGFLGIGLLGITRDRRDNRLFKLRVVKKLTNQICRLISVHDGHVAVHKDEIVVTLYASICGHVIFDGLKSLIAVKCTITNFGNCQFTCITENDLEGINIELFIIHYNDSS